jgi:Tol biopolymer transport system component
VRLSRTYSLASLLIGGLALISCSVRTTTAPSASSSPGGSGHGAAMQQMVFMYWPAGGGQPVGPNAPYEVAIMNVDGTNLKQLTSDGKQKFLPHFSPDGKKVLYTKFAVGGYGSSNAASDVAAFDLASGKETMITSGGNNGYGTWSPDGNRIAYLKNVRLGNVTGPTTLMTIGVDGSNPQTVGAASGASDDWVWVDIAWSSNNWILFGVGETVNGSFCKSRLDKIRPDGTSRTQVSDGGPNCTPPNKEANGDADAGWSSDGKTIYSSRGLPGSPAGPAAMVSYHSSMRKLYAFSSDAWAPSKVEHDLSLPSEPDCIEGVPKGSPDGTRILLYRACFDTGTVVRGIYVTDTSGSYRTFVTPGFGPDWNPAAK